MTSAETKEGTAKGPGEPRRGSNGRSMARLMAVQAIYQMDLTGASVESVVEEFVTHRLERGTYRRLFLDVVGGVAASKEDLLTMVGGALKDQAQLERLEIVLRAIMLCGAYELRSRRDVPPRVAISEYVDVTHSFFGGNEPGLVNGVLDKLARTLREEELSGRGDDAAADT